MKAQGDVRRGAALQRERRRSTQTGTKACYEGSCLPLLATHILPWLCRQRLGPPRQISPGGYYRPEDGMIFWERSFRNDRCRGSETEGNNAPRMVPFFILTVSRVKYKSSDSLLKVETNLFLNFFLHEILNMGAFRSVKGTPAFSVVRKDYQKMIRRKQEKTIPTNWTNQRIKADDIWQSCNTCCISVRVYE